MANNRDYKYLRPKSGSKYRQLFVNGRIMAEILYRETVGREPLTPEQVAAEYNLPVEAVREAIDYCERNPESLDADRALDAALIEADGRNRWPYAPKDYMPGK
jgi:uncharacterized protein (DUF433 family)